MATLDDLKDPYWCAAWNKGCAFLYRNGYLCNVKILDGDNQPLPAAQHEVIERISESGGQPDSRLPPLLWVLREQCCAHCQRMNLIWRDAEQRQLTRRYWQATLCESCYCRLVRGRRPKTESHGPRCLPRKNNRLGLPEQKPAAAQDQESPPDEDQ